MSQRQAQEEEARSVAKSATSAKSLRLLTSHKELGIKLTFELSVHFSWEKS